jgi:ATP-binding cassette subfamily B protein
MANSRLPKTLLPFIWHFLKPHKLIVIICVFLSIAAACWGPIHSMLIKQLINLLPGIQGDVSSLILPAILIIINFIVFDNCTWRGLDYIWAKYVPIIQNKIITVMLDYTLSHSHEFYQNSLSGKISKQISNLVDSISSIITYISSYYLRGLSSLIITFIISYFVNPIFCIISVIWFIQRFRTH